MKTFIVVCGHDGSEFYEVKAETPEKAMQQVRDEFNIVSTYPMAVGVFEEIRKNIKAWKQIPISQRG